MYDPYVDFGHLTLPNGLKVYALHVPGRTFEEIRLTARVGALNEPIPGMAHFVEHLACRSTGRGLAELTEHLDDIGADFNANTDINRTRYILSMMLDDRCVHECFKMLHTMCYAAQFTERTYLEERRVILREMSSPHDVAEEALARNVTDSLLHGTHFAGSGTVIGTSDTISKISLSDLRRFYLDTYLPQNMDLVCVGGLPMTGIEHLLNVHGFNTHREGKSIPAYRGAVPPQIPNNPLVIQRVGEAGSDPVVQLKKTWMLDGSMSHAPIIATRKILQLLLIRHLRERTSLVYGCGAQWRELGPYIEFVIAAQSVHPANIGEVSALIDYVIDQADTEEELFAKQKRSIIRNIQTRDENLHGICDGAANDVLRYGHIKTVRDETAEFESVTFDMVRTVLHQLHVERAVESHLIE